jgi:Copper type II ascorbate-dependent monooxygenase, C-terminal domain
MHTHFELRARRGRRTLRPSDVGFGALMALITSSGCIDVDANLSDGGSIPIPPFRPDAGQVTPTPDAGGSGPVTPAADAAVPATPDAGSVAQLSPWCAVKPILAQRCATCHDGAGTAGTPFGISSYADTLVSAPGRPGVSVAERIGVRVHAELATAEGLGVMPPGRPLDAASLAAIDAWLAAPRPTTEPSCDAPPAQGGDADAGGPPAASAWPPAECDAIYQFKAYEGTPGTPHGVPANGETHPQVLFDAPWGNETVQAIMFHPITDNKKVLHHWILYANGGGFLVGWAPGDDERSPFPADVGMEMPKGPQSLRLDMHYFNQGNSKAEQDQSGVEVCVVKGNHLRPKVAAVAMSLANFGGAGGLAPANTTNHKVKSTCRVTATSPVHLMTAAPHAHQYATHMRFSVKRADGSELVMHDAPFSFGEQGTYPLTPEVVVNTGDQIITECSYTNTTNKNITFGESTTNEMCFNFAAYYPKGALRCSLF